MFTNRCSLLFLVALGTLTLCGSAPCWAQVVGESAPPSPEPAATAAPTIDPQLREQLQSARSTMETFLRAVNDDRLNDAAKCLDLSEVGVTDEARQAKGPAYAYRLKEILDRMGEIDYERIKVRENQEQLFQLSSAVTMDDSALADAASIAIAPDENGLWRFTPDTVGSIDELYQNWKDRNKRESETVSKARRPFEVALAELFSNYQVTHFLIPDYQWLCLLAVIFIGFVADLLTRTILNVITHAWLRYRGEELPEGRRLWRPVGLFAQAVVWYAGTAWIGLPVIALDVLLVGLKFFAVVAAVWTGFRMIDLLAAVVTRKALKTASKFDDLLIPLISKSLKVLAVCIGILQCAQAFNLPIAGLLGGLGIGGAALALASKDAVSNFFGSITVLMDRPFEVGDWVVTDNIEGSVETVGFRSTRIRTFYNSLITLPNSRLTTAVVDNMGRRRYRRVKTTLGLQYDTPPEQIDAFCEGVRELIRRHPYTRKDYYHVYLNELSASSVDILLYCFLECPDWSVELRERHRLLADILKLAHSLGVSFAFPTRTIHMDNAPTPDPPERSWSDPLIAGQTLAARIAGDSSTTPSGPVEFRGPTILGDGGHLGMQDPG